MSVTPQNKLADRAVRVFFVNGGDNHASLHRQGDQRGYGKGVLYEQRGVDDVAVGGGDGKVVLFPLLRPPLRPRNRASLSRSCRHHRPPLPLLPLHLPLPVHRRCRRPRLGPAATAAPLPQPSSTTTTTRGSFPSRGGMRCFPCWLPTTSSTASRRLSLIHI